MSARCLCSGSKHPLSLFASWALPQSSHLSLNAPSRPFMTPNWLRSCLKGTPSHFGRSSCLVVLASRLSLLMEAGTAPSGQHTSRKPPYLCVAHRLSPELTSDCLPSAFLTLVCLSGGSPSSGCPLCVADTLQMQFAPPAPCPVSCFCPSSRPKWNSSPAAPDPPACLLLKWPLVLRPIPTTTRDSRPV